MTIKALKKKLVASLGPSAAYWVIRVLGWTMRFEEVRPRSRCGCGRPTRRHRRLLARQAPHDAPGVQGKEAGLSRLAPPGRPGGGQGLERFGFRPIPGSTTRGGFSGFKGMLRAQREGYDVALVPDGPRGRGAGPRSA